MKNVVILLTLILSTTIAEAQKLVIGSKMPDLTGVQWLTKAPKSTKSIFLDFYQSTNSTCVANIDKIEKVISKQPKLSVVIITRENNAAIKSLVNKYGADYAIGYDPDGKIYSAFGVKFVPFSMIFDAKGEMAWQGNLNQL